MAKQPTGPDGDAPDDEPVPRIPRTAGFKISTAALVRIAMTGALLAMIVVARRPCADSVSSFVTEFDKTGSGAAGAQMPKPGTVDVPSSVGSAGDYEQLRPDMTEAEIKAVIERAKAKTRDAGAGSSMEGSSAGGSNAGGANAGGSNAVGSKAPGSNASSSD